MKYLIKNEIFFNKTACATIFDTPRNYWLKLLTEMFFPLIFYFLKLIIVFMNFQAKIHSFLFHWGINMRWHRDHIPLFIHQHGKDKNTNQMREMCATLHSSRNAYKKIATRLKIPISTVRAILPFGALPTPELPLDVTSMPTNYLEGISEKSLSCHFTTNVSAWSSLNSTGTFHVKISAYTENNLIPAVLWRVSNIVGLFFLQRPWELC